ncbi:MAG: phosphopantetheine-binding protein [Planctomycetota bacterium]
MERNEIMSVLQETILQVIDKAEDSQIIESASLIDDFGADSLQVVEVVSRTMRRLKIRVRRTELSKPKNIGELVDLFEAAQQSA